MVRLYVGGLAGDTTPEQLEQRFETFGKVTRTQIITAKGNDTLLRPHECRGFGYVDLDAKDDTSLGRCLSVYNGSKWKGKVLRVQLAKQDYLSTLSQEWAEAREKAEEELTREQDVVGADPVTLTAPDGQAVVVQANKVKRAFADYEPGSVRELSWEGLPPTAALKRRKLFEERVGPRHAAAAAKRAATRLAKRQQAVDEAKHEKEELEVLGAVNFLEEGDWPQTKAMDLSRFDEGAEAAPDNAALQKLGGAAAAIDSSASSLDEEAEALWEQQGGLEAFLTALQSEQRSPEASSDGEGAAQSPQALREEELSPRGDSGAEGTEPSQASGSSNPSSPTDSPAASSAEEAEMSAAHRQATDSSAKSLDSSLDTAQSPLGHSTEASDEEQIAMLRSVSEGGSEEGELETESREEEEEVDLRTVFAELKAGAEFWAGSSAGKELKSKWQLGRDKLSASMKQARRDAFRLRK